MQKPDNAQVSNQAYTQVSNQAYNGYYTSTLLFASHTARQVLSLISSQLGGLVGPLTCRTATVPLPGGFLSLTVAVEQA